MATSSADFLNILPAAQRDGVSQRTLDLWHRTYLYIEEHGSADTVDDDKFVHTVTREHSMTTTTLARHLRRLNATGVIEGHVLVRRADALTNMLCSPFSANGGLPSRFIPYVLPGQKPTLELRRATKATKDFTDFVATSEFRKDFERFGVSFPDAPPNKPKTGNA